MTPTGDGRSGEDAGDEMRIGGTRRISEMELWDQEPVELMGPAFIEFGHDGTGRFRFIAAGGWMDCRSCHRDGRAAIEFSWEGQDDCDPASGHGWAALDKAGTLRDPSSSITPTTRPSARSVPQAMPMASKPRPRADTVESASRVRNASQSGRGRAVQRRRRGGGPQAALRHTLRSRRPRSLVHANITFRLARAVRSQRSGTPLAGATEMPVLHGTPLSRQNAVAVQADMECAVAAVSSRVRRLGDPRRLCWRRARELRGDWRSTGGGRRAAGLECV